jgi:DNA-directed RNA polymerase subunit RPC12/RpoP
MCLLPEGETMNSEVRCNCQRCGEKIAFSSEMAGQDVTCPHCGRETTLLLPQVRKTDPDSNAPASYDEQKSEMPDVTKVLFGIIGIAVVVISLALFIHHQNETAQEERNLYEATNIEPTFVEKAEAEQEVFSNKLERASWLYTKMGESWTQAEAEAGLPITTNSP